MLQISRRYGMAFVVISHDPTVLAGFAERIVVMQAGRIVEEGRTTDIFRAAGTSVHESPSAALGATLVEHRNANTI